jgi:molybdenum cofactor biosynthesis enzyme MoaA
MEEAMHAIGPGVTAPQWKLWIYTNYDCNLRCSYCVAKSGPNVPRRAIGLANVQRLVDEAVALGFDHVFFTGGEPFLLNDLYAMLAYAAARVKTTVLTNAMLLQQRLPGSAQTRLDRLCAVAAEAGDNRTEAAPKITTRTAARAVGPRRSKASGGCRRVGSGFAWARRRPPSIRRVCT